MTVEELLQKLVDLCREGKGKYEVTIKSYNDEEGYIDEIHVNDDPDVQEVLLLA